MYHANVKDISATIGSKTNLEKIWKHLINISMPRTPTHSWYRITHGIIKSVSYMKILQVYIHNQSVSTKWNQDLQTKKIQTKSKINPALSPHHYHKLPLNHVSKLSMTSWWKTHHLTMRVNQGIKPSKNSKYTSWAPQKNQITMIINLEEIPP